MTAYYNEIDPFAAQWLRNLIAAGHIAPGDVDERSIEDVRPAELMGYAQCHFFAGIGIWSYALRRAGWPDGRPVWTGSCPCQPFSAAGEGGGFADERHLWPAFFHLIRECRPAKVLGEQVASKDAEPWIDLVCADLGSLGYASGAIAFPAASVGAPHIRDRLYWVGNASGAGLPTRERPAVVGARRREQGRAVEQSGGSPGWLADTNGGATEPARGDGRRSGAGEREVPVRRDSAGRVADTDGGNAGAEGLQRRGLQRQQPQDGGAVPVARPGPANGFWRDADWLCCRDGRWRPVEPGAFPLATGIAGRVGQLRAYGNGLNAAAAEIFVACVMEAA